MRLFHFFKGHILAIVICVTLLAVQSVLELSLPNYMSEIVDVGLQQGGISSPVPQTIRETTLLQLEGMMSPEEAQQVNDAYSPAADDGVREYTGSSEDAAPGGALARIMSGPEAMLLARMEGGSPGDAAEGESAGASMGASAPSGNTAQDPAADDASLAGSSAARNDVEDALVSGSDSLTTQRAIAFVEREYREQGVDLSKVQQDYLLMMAAIMFGLCLGTLVTTICVGLVASRAAATIARDTRRRLFARVMSYSPAEVEKFSQASLITRSTNDIQQIQLVCVMILRMVLLAPIMGIVAFVQVTLTRSGMEWIIGIALIAILALLGILFGVTMPKFRRMQSLIDRLNLVSRDMLNGIMPIRAFGREEFELGRFNDASTALMRTQLFVNRAMSFMMPMIMFVMNLVTLLIVWVGANGIEAGNLQVGTMMAFITYTMQIIMSFMMLGMISVILPRAQVSAQRVEEVLGLEPTIVDPADPQSPACKASSDEHPHEACGAVELRNVTFSYPDAEKPVIEGVSLKVETGRTLGIIGSTGSGKSTLIKLIPRLYDVTGGSVMVDGVDVRDMRLSDLRSRIGYVPQQGLLFSGTIETNIKFADEQMPDSQMERAAEIAQATEFIDKEPEKFQTPISQKGSNVSGGQRQRLSIARALAANPEILILDDAFSALDYSTDAKLREALRQTSEERAVIIVAQRVATIMQADEIIVMENGSVVGRGTHATLLESCDAYREIALSQLSASELGIEQASAAGGGDGRWA